MKKHLVNFTATTLFALISIMFFTHPEKYMGCFFDGLAVWALNVLPAIFPFALITALYTKFRKNGKLSVCKLLFKIPCDDLLATSILCGYPLGAKVIANSNADTKTATAMASFCNTAGPIFVIATVGAKALQNATATIIVIASQVVATVLNGLTYTKGNFHYQQDDSNFSPQDFSKILTDNVLSVLTVGGLIALFYMFTEMIQSLLPQSVTHLPIVYFSIGLLEMTNGILGVCAVCDTFSATVLTSTLLSFGGLCVFLQCYAFLSQKNVKAKNILKMKCTQTAYATLIAFALGKIFL